MSKGKFASEQDEAIYNLAQDGEWVGSDDFGLSAALVTVDGAIWWVVTETADGFVEVEAFAYENDARDTLASIEADYADWYLPETAPDYQEG